MEEGSQGRKRGTTAEISLKNRRLREYKKDNEFTTADKCIHVYSISSVSQQCIDYICEIEMSFSILQVICSVRLNTTVIKYYCNKTLSHNLLYVFSDL